MAREAGSRLAWQWPTVEQLLAPDSVGILGLGFRVGPYSMNEMVEYVCTYPLSLHIYICIYAHTCIRLYMYTCICIHVYVYVYVCVYEYAYMCMCIYVCMYVCMHAGR